MLPELLASRCSIMSKFMLCCLTCTVLYVLYFICSTEDTKNQGSEKSPQAHTLCVIVPFRDRFDELLEFVPHMSKFLKRQSINFHINIINQADRYRFNRGSLINAGFKIISAMYHDCDYIAMHDVDLLPLNDDISYAYPGNNAFHVSSRELHPMYSGKRYVGGILLMSNAQFLKVKGFSNRYWGWGDEDHEFSFRLEKNSVQIDRPDCKQLLTNKSNSFKHIHGPHRKRDNELCEGQVDTVLNRDNITGVHDVNYTISSTYSLTINNFYFSVFNVNLTCDYDLTPWCKPDCWKNIPMVVT